MMLLMVGIAIGIILGLTGAGGSIFAVPLLILLLNLPINEAIGISLAAVSIAAFMGVFIRDKKTDFSWMPALILSNTGILFAPIGRSWGAKIDELSLLLAFSLLAWFVAIRMWRQANHYQRIHPQLVKGQYAVEQYDNVNNHINIRTIFLFVTMGLICGLLSGMFGVGGGFLITPLLTLYLGMDIKKAIGTSLFVIALVSASGFLFHLFTISSVSVISLLLSCSGSVIGVLFGTIVAKHIASYKLQKIFAASVIALLTITVLKAPTL